MEAEATIIFTRGKPKSGSKLTIIYAKTYNKPYLHVDLINEDTKCVWLINKWLEKSNLDNISLNVAGSRESSYRGIQERVKKIMLTFLID